MTVCYQGHPTPVVSHRLELLLPCGCVLRYAIPEALKDAGITEEQREQMLEDG